MLKFVLLVANQMGDKYVTMSLINGLYKSTVHSHLRGPRGQLTQCYKSVIYYYAPSNASNEGDNLNQ